MPAPNPPATAAVASPNTDSRAFADVSDIADGQHAGDDGGPQHVVRLRQHQDAERRRVEPEVVEVAHHDQRQDGAADGAAGQRPAPAALQPVQRRTDDRRDDRERRHGHQQVEGDVAALRVGGRGEEEGAGQRDGDHRVAGHVQRVDPQQLGQAALAGAVGPAGRAHPPGGAAAVSCRERATATRVTVTFGGRAGGSSGTTSVGCSSAVRHPGAASVGPPGCGTPSGVVSTRSGPLGPACPPTARAGANRAVGGRRARRPWCRTRRCACAAPAAADEPVDRPARVRDNGPVTDFSAPARSVPADPALVAAVELARAAAVETAGDPQLVGEHLGAAPEAVAPETDEVPVEALGTVLTHTFASRLPGYVGWHWAVTVARAAGRRRGDRRRGRAAAGRLGAAGPGLGAVARAAAPG